MRVHVLKSVILAEKTPKNDLFSNRHLLVWYESGSQIFFLNESLLLAFIFTQYPIKICVPSLEFQKKIKKVERGVF